MCIEEISVDSKLYDDAMELRYALFFREFDLPRSVTADELESSSFHAVISKDDELLAYGRLSPIETGVYRISQIVVPEKHRHKGYASRLLRGLIKLGASNGARILWLNSQVSVKKLYHQTGFREVGEVYRVKLTGVEHIKMEYHVRT